MDHTYHLRLLGPISLEHSDRQLPAFKSRKALALLGYLARRSESITRSHLASLLWGDTSDPRSRRNLTRELSALSAGLPECFHADYHTIQWTPTTNAWVDTAAFESLLLPSAAESAPAVEPAPLLIATTPSDTWFARPAVADLRPDRLAAAVALYRGEFMAGLYLDDCPEFEIWLTQEREFWRQQMIAALDSLISYHARRHEDDQAQHYARRWLALEPWREEVHRILLILLARNDGRSAALAHYSACRRALIEELGVEPAAETLAVVEQIRSGALCQESPALRNAVIEEARAEISASRPRHYQGWGDAPENSVFYGRQAEIATLERWLVADRCRIIALVGMGGVGKTALAAQLARTFAPQFAYVFWYSLLDAPALSELLRTTLRVLSTPHPLSIPDALDEQLVLLIDYLRRHRCLIILDRVDALFQAGTRAGQFCSDYAAYGRLIERLGGVEHQGCLLLTSREQPLEVAQMEAALAPIRSLQLEGLDIAAARAVLHVHGLAGAASVEPLITRYSGNPLALKLVAATIRDLFGRDTVGFLRNETTIFDDIRDVLDQQFDRLPALERAVLFWLAIECEALSLQSLEENLANTSSRRAVLEAVRSLQRRSLLDRHGDRISMRDLVTDYVTDRLIEQVCQELEAGTPVLLRSHALLTAQAQEDIRQRQLQRILRPVAQRSLARLGPIGLEARVKQLLATLRVELPLTPSYTGGNCLNILLHLGYDLRGYDFSYLSVWQVDLRAAALPVLNVA